MTQQTADQSTNNEKKYTHVLAVYGTLKGGFGNHHRLYGAKYLGRGRVNGLMGSFPGFPWVVLYSDIPINHPAKSYCAEKWTVCEIYHITDEMLSSCDQLEGHPKYYKRQVAHFTGGYNGEAWIYTMTPEKQLKGLVKVIQDGIWAGSNLNDWVEVDFYDGNAKPRIIRLAQSGVVTPPGNSVVPFNPNNPNRAGIWYPGKQEGSKDIFLDDDSALWPDDLDDEELEVEPDSYPITVKDKEAFKDA